MKTPDQRPLVRTGYPEKAEVAPEDVKLADQTPLYYAYLPGESVASGLIKPHDSQQAHEHLRELFAIDPDAVLSCEGKTLEEARAILDSIHPLQQAA